MYHVVRIYISLLFPLFCILWALSATVNTNICVCVCLCLYILLVSQTSGYLNLLANCIDNFTHGLAVAGSFLVSKKVRSCGEVLLFCVHLNIWSAQSATLGKKVRSMIGGALKRKFLSQPGWLYQACAAAGLLRFHLWNPARPSC